MKIDPTSPLPLYKQVKQQLLDRMRNNEIPAGAKLASERELMAELGVSRITVRQALKELVLQGHVHTIPGKGFYRQQQRERGFALDIMRSFTESAYDLGKVPGSLLLSCKLVTAGQELATFLQVQTGTQLVELRRLRTIDKQPAAINIDWTIAEHTTELLDVDWTTSNRSLYSELDARFGISPTEGDTLISACILTGDEARLLQVTPPTAALFVQQIARDKDGQLVNGSYSYQIPEIYPLQLHQRAATSG